MTELLPSPDPLVPIPLSRLLQLLWGYKKGADLRDRCVPGEDIVALLDAHVPADVAAKHYVIQKPKAGSEGLSIVWQKDEWKTCGARDEERKIIKDKIFGGIEKVIDTLKPKFPMLTRDMIRALADDLINKKDWTTLQAFGVDTKEME